MCSSDLKSPTPSLERDGRVSCSLGRCHPRNLVADSPSCKCLIQSCCIRFCTYRSTDRGNLPCLFSCKDLRRTSQSTCSSPIRIRWCQHRDRNSRRGCCIANRDHSIRSSTTDNSRTRSDNSLYQSWNTCRSISNHLHRRFLSCRRRRSTAERYRRACTIRASKSPSLHRLLRRTRR